MATEVATPQELSKELEWNHPTEDCVDWIKRQGEILDRLKKEGKVILNFQVADGYAHYLVIQEKPLVVAHLNICDGYRIPAAHVRGLDHTDVEGQRKRDAFWAEMKLKRK